jgi:hypothetical protein
MTWSISEITTTTFSFVFLITTIVSYVYSDYSYIKIPLAISTILTLCLNIASVILHLKGAWHEESGSIERKTHIGFGIAQFILIVFIVLIIKALN